MSFSAFRTLLVSLGLTILSTTLAMPLHASGQAIEKSPDGVTLHLAGGTLHVGVCSVQVIHVVASATAEIPKQVVPSVNRPCAGASFTVTSDARNVSIRTGSLRVDIDRSTGAVRFLTSTGKPVLSEQTNGGRTISPVSINGTNTYVLQQGFQLSAGEALYGLGQHQEGFFNLRDIPVELLHANTNIAIPFVVSTKGYGLLWNNASLTSFNPTTEAIQLDEKGVGTFHSGPAGEYGFLLSGNGRSKLRLSLNDEPVIDIKNMWLPESAGGKMHLAADTTYKVIAESGGKTGLRVRAPSDTMSFHSEAGPAVDYYFLYGPDSGKIVAEYREFTGAAPLLPRWAYGFWQCRERYSSQQQILDTVAEFRKRKIPVDVFVQDWQYWGKYGWNAMRFDEKDYPDPAKMLSDLHRENIHMVISVWAKFGKETEVNRHMGDAHLLLSSPASTGEPGEAAESESWADLFNPKAQQLFWSEINLNLFRQGLDGWWLDASEPEGDPLKNDKTFLGPGKLVRNAYPLYETSAVYQGQRAADENKRVVILSRSAFTGQQRNGSISWSGDISGNWETLRRQIPAGLSFGISGFPYWTTDVGGFFRPRDQYTSPDYRELLIRWFQYGAFCPIFRVHGFRSETEMWKYGPEVESILKQYDELRYRMLPYIYSAAWGVTSRGETMMQALPFVYPNDLSVRDVRDQFLFGDSLLVNPVTAPNAKTRNVVLPAGNDWVDFWTGEKYRGGQTIAAESPLDRMPILVREGSIVPLGPVIQSAAELQDPLEIRVYGGKDADYQLYEDGGDGYAYERGARAVVSLHWNDRLHELTIGDRAGSFPGMQTKRSFKVVLTRQGHGVGVGTDAGDRSVTYTGHRITVNLSKAG